MFLYLLRRSCLDFSSSSVNVMDYPDLFSFFKNYYFIIIIFLLYNIVLVLPYINMHLPRVYTYFQMVNQSCFPGIKATSS